MSKEKKALELACETFSPDECPYLVLGVCSISNAQGVECINNCTLFEERRNSCWVEHFLKEVADE